MRHSFAISGVLTAMLVVGCSTQSPSPLQPSQVRLAAVSPVNGATDVRLDAALTLTFSAPVNREVVQRQVHLVSEAALADSACPDSATMSHLGMEHYMSDSAMMNHIDKVHAAAGTFSWNAAGTECTFKPTDWMTPKTRHMIHGGSELTDMLGSMDSMIGEHGSGVMSREVALHFTTMDTSGGHDGHH